MAPSDCLIDDCHRVTGNQLLLRWLLFIHALHFLDSVLEKPLRTSIEIIFVKIRLFRPSRHPIHKSSPNLPFNWSSTHLLIKIFIVWVLCHLSSDVASWRNAQEIWGEKKKPLYVLAEWWRSESMLDGWRAFFFRRVGTVTSSVAGKWVNLKARRV